MTSESRESKLQQAIHKKIKDQFHQLEEELNQLRSKNKPTAQCDNVFVQDVSKRSKRITISDHIIQDSRCF